jgi:hypothetical protein
MAGKAEAGKMDAEKKNEEIIELTEVVEEGADFRAAAEPPRAGTEDRPPPAGEFPETASRQAGAGAAGEGPAIVRRPAEDLVPRIDAEALQKEMSEIRKEAENLKAQTAGLARLAEQWFSEEGKETLERFARAIFPEIAEKVLREEIRKLKEEIRPPEKG